MKGNCKYWLKIGIIILATVLIRIPAFAQVLDQQILGTAAMEIRATNKNVTDTLLTNDQKVITSAFPTIKTDLTQKGFSEADINAAITSSWVDLRGKTDSLAHLDGPAFISYTKSLGKLTIKSNPHGANISIDANLCGKTTNADLWLRPKLYRITLSKDGYFPVEENLNIVEGENPPLNKTLRQKSANP